MTAKTQQANEKQDVAPGSVLDQFAQMRDEIADDLFTEIEVPQWREKKSLPIVVVYSPVDHETIRNSMDVIARAKKRKDGNVARVELEQNIKLLLEACHGIYAEVDGEKLSLNPKDRKGDWTRFDLDLADALGMPQDNRRAQMICRRLFFTDGDVLTHAGKVIEFSGYGDREADEDFAGK